MHGPCSIACLHLILRIEDTVWESLALANAMTAMAPRRDYAWHAIGALGVIELTAPGRSAAVAAGLKRLGVNGQTRLHFDLHAALDVKHSAAWNAEAIAPAVADDAHRAVAIAEGALIRCIAAHVALSGTAAICGERGRRAFRVAWSARARDYRFTTVTPDARASSAAAGHHDPRHLRLDRPSRQPKSSRLFSISCAARMQSRNCPAVRSRIRVDSQVRRLFLHSAFPTRPRIVSSLAETPTVLYLHRLRAFGDAASKLDRRYGRRYRRWGNYVAGKSPGAR